MVDRYVILNSAGGWLENTILWDGVTPFEVPPGTEIKKESEIDHPTLPPRPEQTTPEAEAAPIFDLAATLPADKQDQLKALVQQLASE